MHRRAPTTLMLLALVACGSAEEANDPQAALVARGRALYETVCTACHARRPTEPGPVGPPIAGSPEDLLRAKVLRNEYPPGYTPKRNTHAMVPFPHLEPDIPALAAYLASFSE